MRRTRYSSTSKVFATPIHEASRHESRRRHRRQAVTAIGAGLLGGTALVAGSAAVSFVQDFPEVDYTVTEPESTQEVSLSGAQSAPDLYESLPEAVEISPEDLIATVTQDTAETPTPPTPEDGGNVNSTETTAPSVVVLDDVIVAAPAPTVLPDRVLIVGGSRVAAAEAELGELFETAGVELKVDAEDERPTARIDISPAAIEAAFTPPAEPVTDPEELEGTPAEPDTEDTTAGPPVPEDSAQTTSTTVAAEVPQEPPVELPTTKTLLVLGEYDFDPEAFERSLAIVLEAAAPQEIVVVTLEGKDAFNDVVVDSKTKWPEISVADWAAFSADHPEWFRGSDLSAVGVRSFSRFLAAAVFDRGVAQ